MQLLIQEDENEYLDLCEYYNEEPVYRKNQKVYYDKDRYNIDN
jgi:hypothetical protein